MAEYTDEELNRKLEDLAGVPYGLDDIESRPQVLAYGGRWDDIDFDSRWWRGVRLTRVGYKVIHKGDAEVYDFYACLPEETALIRAKLVALVDNPTIHAFREYNDWLHETFEIYFRDEYHGYLESYPRPWRFETKDGEKFYFLGYKSSNEKGPYTEAELRKMDNDLRRKYGLKVFGE